MPRASAITTAPPPYSFSAVRLAVRSMKPARAKRVRRPRQHHSANNRNLITVAEAAAHFGIAQSSVYVLLQLGLPSIKSIGLGRRIIKDKAEAWLLAGGAQRSLAAKRLREKKSHG